MAKSAISGQNRVLVPVQNRGGTGTTLQREKCTGTNQSGTGTTHQNSFGTGTTASYNPDFWYSYIVKLKFTHRGYRNPN